MPVAMTQRASTCLSLLALLSSFPLSLGDATHMSGSSLIGVSTVSEILDQFFKKQEIAGRKPPVWKQEAQAMIALVQSLKDINSTTQATVDGYVRNIIDTLKVDVNNTKAEQAAAKVALDALETAVRRELGNLVTQLDKVKNFSATSKACRADVASQKNGFYNQLRNGTWKCADHYRNAGGYCPTECGKPSTAEFELTSEAKDTYTCNFEAGDTAKQCVDKLWAKVNMTRQNLTNKYNSWFATKNKCELNRTRCATCNPIWDAYTNSNTSCNGKRDVGYAGYCTLQTEQNDFCSASATLHTQWSTVLSPAQVARVSEYSDLEFIICIFEKYLIDKSFTTSMVSGCTRKTAADFYTFTLPTGELKNPNVDDTMVPKCSGTVTHTSGSTLWDMTGLVNEFNRDGYGSTVSTLDHVYSPSATGAICDVR